MNGKGVFVFSRAMFVKSPRSMATVVVMAVLLSGLFHDEPALAADGCPTPSFAAPIVYNAGDDSYSMAVGDLNGDGKLDLAVANSSSTDISVLLGNGDGTFQPATSYGAGVGPWSVVVGDFNGDGKPDMAAANWGGFTGSVSVLLGNGDGTFQTAANYGTGMFPVFVAVGDFNGDAKLDLAVANRGGISVLLGNGDGTFQRAVNYALFSRPQSIAVGDFNSDGKLDLLVADNAEPGGVAVLLGRGDGSFQLAGGYATGPYPQSIAVRDLNGDGKLDVAVAAGSGAISVLLGKGDGSFEPAFNYNANASSQSVAVGDFNGDGKLDLVLPNNTRASVSVLLGNGDGTFGAATNFGAGLHPYSVAVRQARLGRDERDNRPARRRWRVGARQHLCLRRHSPQHCAKQDDGHSFMAAAIQQLRARSHGKLQPDDLANRRRAADDKQWPLRGHRAARPTAILLPTAQALGRRHRGADRGE